MEVGIVMLIAFARGHPTLSTSENGGVIKKCEKGPFGVAKSEEAALAGRPPGLQIPHSP